ncbi:MAG: ankyrin repeat domain-containing protein, partial [Planctomycetes bacterium]|nr:ankyrin repeat domain-containing protein [Planctomycetota bacterium]
DRLGRTPLHLACSPEMVRLLCAAGANVEARAHNGVRVGVLHSRFISDAAAGRTAAALAAAGAFEDLATAARGRSAADVKRILAREPELDVRAIHFAARRGDREVIAALIATGVPLDQSFPTPIEEDFHIGSPRELGKTPWSRLWRAGSSPARRSS